MSVGPRILFTRFVNGDSPKLQPWIAHVRRVVPGAALSTSQNTVSGDDPVVVWQLISGNNRQLARSARVHSSFQRATEEARWAIESIADLKVSEVSDLHRGSYGWFAELAGEPILTCSRWYSTERDRLHSIRLALGSLPIAEVLTGARLMDPAIMSGSRDAKGA
jgi:hypothetical protein